MVDPSREGGGDAAEEIFSLFDANLGSREYFLLSFIDRGPLSLGSWVFLMGISGIPFSAGIPCLSSTT